MKNPNKNSKKSSPAFKRTSLSVVAAASFGIALPVVANALELDYRLKASVVGVADGGRDLNLTDADSTREAYVDATPWVHLQFSDDWAAFARVRAYVPSGKLLQPGNDDNNEVASSKAFVALKEAWVEYGGLTSYPGESLRLGRQRIHDDDAQFFDQDIDALRWIVDTTMLNSEVGVAHQFDSYRSDGEDVAREQKDRTYLFGHIDYDWAARQRIGVRLVHSIDHENIPDVGEPVDINDRTTQGDLTWVGVYADNHPYDWRPIQPQGDAVSYWSSATYLTGNRDRIIDDPITHAVTGTTNEDTKAWAAETGIRANVGGPVQVGAAYSYSGGGTAADGDKQYEQTGVQSNYSRFTGTRAQVYRYNEAYRPELGDLQVTSVFASLGDVSYDASLVYNNFRRTKSDGPVVSDGLTVDPVQNSHDLGSGLDLVMSKYFSLNHIADADLPSYTPGDDAADSSIRLRASWFNPGKAYGPDAKDEYRVMLELTLWY
jgi:alginate production protein